MWSYTLGKSPIYHRATSVYLRCTKQIFHLHRKKITTKQIADINIPYIPTHSSHPYTYPGETLLSVMWRCVWFDGGPSGRESATLTHVAPVNKEKTERNKCIRWALELEQRDRADRWRGKQMEKCGKKDVKKKWQGSVRRRNAQI